MNRSFLLLSISCLTLIGCEIKPSTTPPATTPPATTPPATTPPPKVTSSDVKRDALVAWKSTTTYSQQNKDQLVKDFKSQLATMDANIDALRLKGKDLAQDAKAQWDLKMTELDQKRLAAHKKLTEVENATAQAWSDIEQGSRAAWEELTTAFQKASSEF